MTKVCGEMGTILYVDVCLTSLFSIGSLTYLNGFPPAVKPSAGMVTLPTLTRSSGRGSSGLPGVLCHLHAHTPMLRGSPAYRSAIR